MHEPRLRKPTDLSGSDGDNGFPPPFVRRLFLAEGDSWFTIGRMVPFDNTNLLRELRLAEPTGILDCSYPGHTLQHMVDGHRDPYFDLHLRGPQQHTWRWHAILLSAGGNDLIDAAQVPPRNKRGAATPLHKRLLLTPAEAASVQPHRAGPDRHVSEPGWATLADYLVANFQELVRRREQGISRGRPIFLHTYHVPVARPSGTVGAPAGWLFPALEAYGIPAAERQPLVAELFGRLRRLLLGLDADAGQPGALPQLHVFDSATAVSLIPANPAAVGPSGDWVNEIHPSIAGYRKLATRWSASIEALLAARYP